MCCQNGQPAPRREKYLCVQRSGGGFGGQPVSQRAIAAAEAWDLEVQKSAPGKTRDRLAATFLANRDYVQKARALVERDPDALAIAAREASCIDDTPLSREGRKKLAGLFRIGENAVQQARAIPNDLAASVKAGERSLADAYAEQVVGVLA